MKPELTFPFEHAGWPVFLVSNSGHILKYNAAALQGFGTAVQGNLEGIWARTNPVSHLVFLEKWQRQPAASQLLKFNTRGIEITYTTVVCSSKEQETTVYLFQLFPDVAGGGLGHADGVPVEGTLHRQKFDVALQLSKTIALDLNNSLGAVLGHCSMLLMQAEPDHPWRPTLLAIQKAVERGAEAAATLGAFGRQNKDKNAQAARNINPLVQRSVDFVKAWASGRVLHWELQLGKRLFSATFDEPKMQQAVTKVLENAVEATPDNGRIVVSTRNVTLNAPTQDRNVQLNAGNWLCIEISDSGCGIESSILPRVFEPFFTTKRAPNHRGLGLAWVYGVVTNLNGGVAISSDPGKGTSVRLYLPATQDMLDHAPGVAGEDLRGTQKVLVVDDEELVLSMAAAVLRSHGYTVLEASSGEKALELISASKEKIDAVVTDLVMPGMNGAVLTDRLKEIDPGVPVLIISGAPGEERKAGRLSKPFTSRQLLEAVWSLLRNPA